MYSAIYMGVLLENNLANIHAKHCPSKICDILTYITESNTHSNFCKTIPETFKHTGLYVI